jgi:hypothetical protein
MSFPLPQNDLNRCLMYSALRVVVVIVADTNTVSSDGFYMRLRTTCLGRFSLSRQYIVAILLLHAKETAKMNYTALVHHCFQSVFVFVPK